MKAISDRMARLIVKRSGREDVYAEVVSYGLQAVLGTLAEFAAVVLAGYLLGMLKEMVLMSVVFAAMRMVAGGVHLSTYPRCFISSVAMLTLGGCLSRAISKAAFPAGAVFLISASIFITYSLYKYSPRDNPNRLIKEEELPGFRRLSFILWMGAAAFAALSFLVEGGLRWYHFSMITGLAIESFTLTDAGYRLFTILDRFISKGGGVRDEKSQNL
ncbi:MAG: hypothetical protein HPY66_0686 [Firmicutes bacterium]|nr:hypothetical protein [Bacillota bacterium]